MRRAPALLACLLLVTTTGAGCGEDDARAGDEGGGTVEITIEGGTASPLAERVDVAVGEEVDLVVKADGTGQIHVHSEPEQEFTYEPGTNTFSVSVDRPGVVDIETHDPAQVVVRLEVR